MTNPNTDKHTPGPWYYGEQFQPKHSLQHAIGIGDGAGCIAQVNAVWPEAKANARLIAAAPEQNAALQAIDKLTCNCPCMPREAQKAFSSHPAMEAYRVEVAKLILAIREKARAALAKAS